MLKRAHEREAAVDGRCHRLERRVVVPLESPQPRQREEFLLRPDVIEGLVREYCPTFSGMTAAVASACPPQASAYNIAWKMQIDFLSDDGVSWGVVGKSFAGTLRRRQLHGFASSSHQYRYLLEELSDDDYLIAPDYPGFGAGGFPSPDTRDYTFDNIAETV